MIQSGLLVPVHPDSAMGIFRQLMIHIGDHAEPGIRAQHL